jgi:hypothetical protein
MMSIYPVKFVTSLLVLVCFAPLGYAASECPDVNGDAVKPAQCANASNGATSTGSGLPEDALAEVKELDARMRFFTSIGFHKQSKERRDAIVAIYREHGVPVPEQYRD